MKLKREILIIATSCVLLCPTNFSAYSLSEIGELAELLKQLFLASRTARDFSLESLKVDTEEFPAVDFVVKEDVVYSEVDGEILTMDVYYPARTTAPRPAILYVHGGAWITGDKRSGPGVVVTGELIRAGFIVFSIDYRLAPKWKFPSQVIDVKTAIRFVRENSTELLIDPEAIGGFGTSAGAHLVTLAALTANTGMFSEDKYSGQDENLFCVADLYGPTDLEALFEGIEREVAELIFGNEEGILRKASPINYVNKDSPPFLIVQGDSDLVVPVDQSKRFFEELTAAGCYSKLVVVENAGHGLVPDGGEIKPSLIDVAKIVVGFFQRQMIIQQSRINLLLRF
ncbi:esterase/lipase [Mesotoga prima MesG1.Ag.4.2]|uniref:Esterase/lipase n=1 Tax=Mesotoga prima MesG1.Ag.4.2 TaxID=660470 RepID=I2F573_9BACT|nr:MULTISPECIES: alpha/beta hydrolase [Mesotoga]MCP5457769.1 alpha/beta hydrolase [Thermotogota bacterium]AFK07076.1 esterase/lipase [Mesotoga prima MesG1.Ag.4.2]PIJ63327.1 esterase [Mesotoga sp. H07.pep.5.3]HNQ70616.1 alpha/beta hydrolase [Mesotoga prima]HNS75545.1 alpha/beta hydrolase [Mesotoga prima]